MSNPVPGLRLRHFPVPHLICVAWEWAALSRGRKAAVASSGKTQAQERHAMNEYEEALLEHAADAYELVDADDDAEEL